VKILYAVQVGLTILGFYSGVAQAMGGRSETDVAMSLGYRMDSLDWNINGEGNPVGSSPNILSELEWRDLQIMQLKTEFTTTNYTGFVFRGNLDYGWVRDGENQDSDYAGDNRTLEFSRSINDVDGSRVFDISGGLGFNLFAGDIEEYRISPMVGYSYHRQNLRMKNGNQRLYDLANYQVYDPSATGTLPLGPFPGLNSSYEATWKGFWLGVDMEMELTSGNRLFARLEAHKADYSAEANWNLRSEFAHPVSFTHDANGQGGVLTLGWKQMPDTYRWRWGVTFTLQNWSTDSGTDNTFFTNGAVNTGKLNEANWSSRSIDISLQKHFR
jgi:hypothetical protein